MDVLDFSLFNVPSIWQIKIRAFMSIYELIIF